MKKIILSLSTLIFVLILLAGCRSSAVVVRERPTPPVYFRPAPPSPAYIWTDGNWVRSGRGYAYRQGHWVVPRQHRHRYVPGHWQKTRQGWVWIKGH